MGEKCFTTALNTSCRGDFSFKTLVFPCPVCGIFRLARSDGGREREIVRPAHEKWPKTSGLWRAGRILSRVEWGEGPCWANFVAPAGPLLPAALARPPSPAPLSSPEQSLARHYPGPSTDCRPRRHTWRCLGTHHIGVGGGFAALGAGFRRVVGVSGF